MPERCPICDQEECTHSPDEKKIAKLEAQVKMLEGAIAGWKSLLGNTCADCNCGKAEGCGS